MPKISYQEIVTPDISESGLILHEWEYTRGEHADFDKLYHNVNGVYTDKFHGKQASNKWSDLCQSK